MRLTFLGTGAADGLPNPWCGCPSCEDARQRGHQRRPTSVLVDDVLLLDLAPGTPPPSTRLDRVRTVLVTHAHPDHCSPFSLLWRHWAGRREQLTLAGPAPVLAECRPWLAPEDPVRLVEVAPGDEFDLAGYRVRVLAAQHEVPTVLYDVTGPAGHRLLYATDTGPLPARTVAAVRDAAFDVVLLEQTFGPVLDHGTAHLDLGSFPDQLRRLRDVGAIGPRTDVVAVHLSHHNPPLPELTALLAAHGTRTVDDGAEIAVRCRAEAS